MPDDVWMSPTRVPWSSTQEISCTLPGKREELAETRKYHHDAHLAFVKLIYDAQVAGGQHAHLRRVEGGSVCSEGCAPPNPQLLKVHQGCASRRCAWHTAQSPHQGACTSTTMGGPPKVRILVCALHFMVRHVHIRISMRDPADERAPSSVT